MYSAGVAAVRALLGYVLVAPLVLGALVATLLATNIAASYWFQRQQRRQKQQRQRQKHGFQPHAPANPLAVDPPIPRIPRLLFAAQLPRTLATSLFPTAYNGRAYADPELDLGELGFGRTASELLQLLKLAVRDFVQSWFGDITADESFPRCVLAQMAQAVDAVTERVARADAAEVVVGQLLPIVTAHIHAVKASEAAVRELAADAQTQGMGIADAYAGLAAARWHPALRDMRGDASEDEQKRRVMAHVRRVVSLLVPLILAPEQSSFAPHRVLVRELLTGALLAPVVLSLADPDTANQLLDSQLARLIREQHMVNELRDALDQQARGDRDPAGDDAHVPDKELAVPAPAGRRSSDNGQRPADEAPVASGAAAVRTYEQFMSTIDECADVDELRRIHEDILAQIRKRRILIMGQNKDDIVHGQRVRDVLVYINRLYVAKKKAERRLEMLGRDLALSAASKRHRSQQSQQPQHLRRRGRSSVGSARPASLASAASLPDPHALATPTPLARGALGGRAYSASGSSPPRSTPAPRLLPQRPTVSRVSTYYQHRDDPATLGPPQFTLREILTNVSSLSAFAEYMDVIGSKFLVEFWVNVEGIREASKPRELFPSIVCSLWKNYFTLRVDELASIGTDEVEMAISRVQRLLKPFRVLRDNGGGGAGALDLDVGKMDEMVCREAFELICVVQRAVFRHMELSVMPPFSRSAFYSRLLKEYYVTPRHAQIEAALFEAPAVIGSEALTGSEALAPVAEASGGESDASRAEQQPSAAGGRRRASVRSVRSAGEPGARRWNFALRGKPDAPVVGTSTGQALATEVVGSQVSLAGLVASGDRMTMGNAPLEPGDEPPATNDEPPVTSNTTPVTSSMTPVPSAARVGPSEVRRLSASLRSIAVGDDGMRPPSPLAEEPEEEPEEELSEGEDPDAHSGLSQSSSDEAESLVLARVIKTPTPGDLFLDERLMQLSFDLERKTHQMAIVRALMRQAASRQRAHEQRVLRASFRGLRREVHAELEQQRQYELALADHTVSPTRTRVHIPRAVAAAADPGEDHEDADPRPHVVYLIELQQSLPPAAGPAVSEHASSGWMVARRFREFFAMHRELKAAYPHEMRAHELPARTPLLRLQRDRDIEHRRSALERYLQGLLREPQVANSRAVRLFLSSAEPPATRAQAPGAGWMEQIYKTVGEDIEGVTGADSMLEIIVQELGAQVAMQQTAGLLAEDRAELEPSSGLFVDPLSDLFVEVFGLTSRRNWLRRQAISVLLRHIVGGAVERRVRQLIGAALDDSLLGGLLDNLKATLWPPVQGSGARAKFAGFAKRSLEQQRQTRERAQQQMLWYVPRMLGSMVGRRNARDGARVLFDAMQHRAPSLSLALNLFDSCVAAIFPEVKFQLDHI